MTLRIHTIPWILLPLQAACGSPGPAGTDGFGTTSAANPMVPNVGIDSGAGTSTGAVPSSTVAPAATDTAAPGAITSAPSPAASAPASNASPSGSAPSPARSSPEAGTTPALSPTGASTAAPAPTSVVLPPARVTPDAFKGAPAFAATVGSSPHNPGQGCGKSGCHGGGGDGNPFLIGGTVYKDYKGTIPAPGVEIRLVDAAGNAVSVYSGTNGNFYVNAGAKVTLPAIVGVRDGTTTRPMVTMLTGTMGTCAAGGCHINGGSPAVAGTGYYPIHVP